MSGGSQRAQTPGTEGLASVLRLPDFLIIGAMKAGTTSLWESLRSHPDVFMPDLKEVEFFAAERTYRNGLDWYAALFAPGADAVAVGEASTIYTKYPNFDGVPERIAAMLPAVRLVYVVRDPVERIRSHYLHNVAHGREARPLAQAVREDPVYVVCSSYTSQLERYTQAFPPEQLLVITSNDLRSQPAQAVGRVLSHIGVDASRAATDHGIRHETGSKRFPRAGVRLVKHSRLRSVAERVLPEAVWDAGRRMLTRPVDRSRGDMSGELRAELCERLAPEVAGLRAFLGQEFDGWGIG